MGKKTRGIGAHHYREKGLRPILAYVSESAHSKLLRKARKKGSLQQLVREILERHAYD